MELDEGETKLSTSHSSEGETFSQEEALSISSEEEDALKGHKRSEGTKHDEKLTLPKDELDGDSSLYSISDLEEDNNSDISFTDVPSLITMDEEPNAKTNVSISQLVSQTSPEHSNVVIYPARSVSSESSSENEAPIEACFIEESLHDEEMHESDEQDTADVVSDEEQQTPTMEAMPQASSSISNKTPEDRESPAELQLSEAVNWNSHDSQHVNGKHDPFTNNHEIPVQAAMNTEFAETRTFSESHDSVLDNSTDGEESSHKEVNIDYRRSLTRKGSSNSDMSATSSVDRDSIPGSYDSGLPSRDTIPLSKYLVVAAIDFGTTYSGYAFAFTRDPESIHMMRRWEGGDPGVSNTKTPTTLLLTPDKRFHSFGFGARDFYHDLEPSEAKKYMYFEKFKMKLYSDECLSEETEIKAANGKSMKAIDVFSYSLRFFKEHVVEELSDQMSTKLVDNDICWVITVPAIWKAGAKQFMRKAAYDAGLTDYENPERVIIALEPEAASIFCRKLRMRDCVLDEVKRKSVVGAMMDWQIGSEFEGKTKYMVVDCGGGTVDLTVHELDNDTGVLKELHKGTGGPCGATGVDAQFEILLKKIFGKDFIDQFKTKRPAGWVDVMIAFEAKKRNSSPNKNNWLNLALPFSFIDYYKKHHKTSSIESAVKKYGDPNLKWSSQGMLRLAPQVMNELFNPVLQNIVKHVRDLLNSPNVNEVKFLFLVGGFAESPLLQHAIRDAFSSKLRVIIPNDVGLTILKGAVLFGLDPTVIRVRRSTLTYGVGVLNKYIPSKHPREKIVRKNGVMWCTDIFDKFVTADQPITLGDRVTRSYAPAKKGLNYTTLSLYCTEEKEVEYITDLNVRKCGELRIELPELDAADQTKPRELQATMTFWDTEIKVSGMDVRTGKEARARIDFLSN
ncbi:Hypothetical predicted protein [Paramuricea clavata]|uniref:Uncharacterized protein n=2 Tax=Paramuricea clavata TaxID=317549 RepID=A0A7D9HRW9_PARCT|nr:Hypothetical predicted protein [Paramuricea clavata]